MFITVSNRLVDAIAEQAGVSRPKDIRFLGSIIDHTVALCVNDAKSRAKVFSRYPGNTPGQEAIAYPQTVRVNEVGCYYVEVKLASYSASLHCGNKLALDQRAVTITVLSENRVFLEKHEVEMVEVVTTLAELRQ